MKITIDELTGHEFARLVEYMNLPQNSALDICHESDHYNPNAYPKSRIMSVGKIEQRSVNNSEKVTQYQSIHFYKGIEVEIAEREMTSEGVLELLKLAYQFKAQGGSQ